MGEPRILSEPIVITGIGLITAVGQHREAAWHAIRHGRSGVRRVSGIRGIPDGSCLAATVDLDVPIPGKLKSVEMCERAADEAIRDAALNFDELDRDRFGCWVSSHYGDDRYFDGIDQQEPDGSVPWQEQFMPHTACSRIAARWQLHGPSSSHATACASGLTELHSALLSLRRRYCDIAVVGSGESLSRLLLAGFSNMRVLAQAGDDPQSACRPFDRRRTGFVLGEGAAMFVVERLSHALRRGARIYAQIRSCQCLAEAHHITGLDEEASVLSRLIENSLERAGLERSDIGYINAHGTATQVNDLVEMRGIRRVFGADAASLCVSATKSMHGHLIGAAGAVELALTTLALRDGFAPPTLNLEEPDPEFRWDGVPLVGRARRFQHALKLSLAFGGHLVAVTLSRWNDAKTGFAYPVPSRVAA